MLDNKPRPEGINNKVKCKQEMPSIKATNQQSLCVAYIAGHPQRLVPSIAAHPCLTPFLPPSLPTSLNPCTHSHMNKNGSTCNLADTVEEHGILDGGPHPVQGPPPQQGGHHCSDNGDPPKGQVYGLSPHPKQLMACLHNTWANQGTSCKCTDSPPKPVCTRQASKALHITKDCWLSTTASCNAVNCKSTSPEYQNRLENEGTPQ